jgi:hypothetical protein
MSHFVIIFDRRRRVPPKVSAYEDPLEAQERLFEAEAELRDDPERGVLLLYAENEESLHRTHGSFFLDLEELLDVARG